jgi:hypothetical protein
MKKSGETDGESAESDTCLTVNCSECGDEISGEIVNRLE